MTDRPTDRCVGATFSLAVLGPLEVQVDGRAIDLGARRLRTLLAALAISANRVVSHEGLIDAVWGPAPPKGAHGTLQGYVHRLRRALEPGRTAGATGRLVVTCEGGYRLVLARDELDAARFERLALEARRCLPHAPARASGLLAEGLDLWRGAALAEVAHLPFARAEAARLEEVRLQAVEDRVRAELALGHHAQLVGELDGLVRAHPFREHLVADHMVALYRSGRQAEALGAYQRLRRDLGEALGIAPGPEVAALEEAILLQRPELAWPVVPATSG